MDNRPHFLVLAEKLAVLLALCAGGAVALLAVLIFVDIIGRDFLGVSVQGTDEIGGYVLAFVGSLGMALTLLRRGHPRIDLFFRFFPRLAGDVLHVLAQVTIAGLAIFMTWHAWSELQTTLRFGSITNTPLQTPLWVPQAIWVFGTAFFGITACLTSAHAIYLLVRNRTLVPRFYGPVTIDEEVSQYVGDAKQEADNARN
jgi:TRAP-type C4-dicarboxylate transport system permease small subunit